MIEITDRQILVDGQPRVVMCGEVLLPRGSGGVGAADPAAEGARLQRRGVVHPVALARAARRHHRRHGCHPGRARRGGVHRPVRRARAVVRGAARSLRHGRAEERGPAVPALHRASRDRADRLGRQETSRTVDYLAPAYLEECDRWYAAIMPLLAARLQPAGGNVIAVQLDNEIGMLAWVTNSPDLTDHLVADFGRWLGEQGRSTPTPRRPGTRASAWPAAVRSPRAAWSGPLRRDLAEFMRDRFRRYVEALRGMAERRACGTCPSS